MVTSFFSNDYYSLLTKAINKDYLSSSGFKTYGYMEDNIRPLMEEIISDKDSYRLISSLSIKSIDEDVNVWLVGYYDYSDIPKNLNSVYVGKSICFTNDSENLVDKTNLVFNTSVLNEIEKSENKINALTDYWKIILVSIFSNTNMYSLTQKYKESQLFGLKVENFYDYIELAIIYHLYKFISGYSRDNAKIKKAITENDVLIGGSKWFNSKGELYKFIELVQRYNRYN